MKALKQAECYDYISGRHSQTNSNKLMHVQFWHINHFKFQYDYQKTAFAYNINPFFSPLQLPYGNF